MRVYLVRHGKAVKTGFTTDAERELTGTGRREVQRIAEMMAEAGVEVAQIRHSGLVRAAQTADILGEVLRPPNGVIAVRGLHYNDPITPLVRELHLEHEPLMLVGHNPFMEHLAGALLTRNTGSAPLWFTTATTACLDYSEGVWYLRWMLSRDFLKDGE